MQCCSHYLCTKIADRYLPFASKLVYIASTLEHLVVAINNLQYKSLQTITHSSTCASSSEQVIGTYPRLSRTTIERICDTKSCDVCWTMDIIIAVITYGYTSEHVEWSTYPLLDRLLPLICFVPLARSRRLTCIHIVGNSPRTVNSGKISNLCDIID